MKITGFINLFLIPISIFCSQSAWAADMPANDKESSAVLVGKTALQDLLSSRPKASQVVKHSSGTSVIYAYKMNSTALPSKSRVDVQSANAIELNFDQNETLSSIGLIDFKGSK